MRPYLTSEELDLQGLRQFLSLGYVFEPRTLFKQVHTLEPWYRTDDFGDGRHRTPVLDTKAEGASQRASALDGARRLRIAAGRKAPPAQRCPGDLISQRRC